MNITNLGAGLFEKSYARVNKGHLLVYVYLIFVYVSSLFIFLELFATRPLEGYIVIRDIMYYRCMVILFGLFFKASVFLFVYAVCSPFLARWLLEKRLFIWTSMDIILICATFALTFFTGSYWFYYDSWVNLLNFASNLALEQVEMFGDNTPKVVATSPVNNLKSPTSLAESLKDRHSFSFNQEVGGEKTPVKTTVYVGKEQISTEKLQYLKGRYGGLSSDGKTYTVIEDPCTMAKAFEIRTHSEPARSGFWNRLETNFERTKISASRYCACFNFFSSRVVLETVAPVAHTEALKPSTGSSVMNFHDDHQSLVYNSPGNSPTEGHRKNSLSFPFRSSKK